MGGVRLERRGSLAALRLDKARGNAIDAGLVEDLIAACREVAADPSVRGTLLASAHPKLFSGGLDLVDLAAYDRPAMERFMGRFAEMVYALYTLPMPVVAAVSGHAIAGGCILALTADYRVLRRGDVQIGLNEVRVGVPLPGAVLVLLRSCVPAAALPEIALLGRNFADDEAVSHGLVHALADPAGFEDFCVARLEEFAEKDAAAVRAMKAALRAPIVREMQERERELMSVWLDRWFSETTRARMREIVQSLGRPRS
jgi:enoyl-CoA hydratase/carnithine racemase